MGCGMAGTKRILTIFGTRPEAITLFPLVHALEADDRFDSRVCVSGQHRGMLDQVLQISGVTPHHDLDLMQPDQTLDALTARLLTGLGGVMDTEQPDWVVVQGDTATAMAGALATYYRKIPVCHVEAGLRSGNIYHPWPEEVNRKIIGDIAALQWVTAQIEQEPQLASGLAALEKRFAGKRIIGATTHRRENFGEGMQAIADAIRRLAARAEVAVIFPVHLNPNVRAVMDEALGDVEDVAMIEPLDYPHFARLLDIADLILTDSGGVQEEAPALGKPVLVMRETTERPEGVEAGTAKLVGTDADVIVAEANRLLDDHDAYLAMARAHNPFGDGKSAQRICDLLCEHS